MKELIQRPSPHIPSAHLVAECDHSESDRVTVYRLALGFRLPICQPHDRRTLTTFGVTAAVRGTLTKMNVLWMAYASASWVARPVTPC